MEVVNAAPEEVNVRLGLSAHGFRVRQEDGEGFEIRETSDVMHLDGNETRTFAMIVADESGIRDSAADNELVRNFFGIEFFQDDADWPYKGYGYATYGCVGGGCCECEDELLVYGSRYEPRESRERLFVESPTRPFYLERDKDDLDLARIVITFVPSAESGVESPRE